MNQSSSIIVQLGLVVALQISAAGQQQEPSVQQPKGNTQTQQASTADSSSGSKNNQAEPNLFGEESAKPAAESAAPAAPLAPAQGVYAEPDISDATIPVIIRSKLPIEKERMLASAWQLKQLIGVGKKAPQDWQNRARIVALISALNADEADLGKINNELKKQVIPPLPELHQYQQSLQSLWTLCGELAACEEASEGKKLHACLLDILSQIDSSNPLAKAEDAQAESRWSPLVKNLQSFSPQKAENKPAQSKPETANPAQMAALSPKLARTAASMPMFCDPQQSTAQIVGKMELTHNGINNQSNDSTGVRFEPSINDAQRVLQSYGHFVEFAKRRWPNWPKGGEFKIALPGQLHNYESNSNFLGLAVALMFESCFSGNLASNSTLSLAELLPDGKLGDSKQWWRAVNTIAAANPEMRTLLTTPKIGEKLANLLVLGKPEFFLINECIGVENFDNAVSSSLKPSDIRKQNAVSFNEIRNIYNEKRMSVPAMCSNIYVRERLQKILASEPNHISAAMLLLQGDSIKRPQKLSAEVVAREIKDAIRPTLKDMEAWWEHKQSEEWDQIAESAAQKIEPIKKYVDRDQQELLRSVTDAIGQLRSCARYMRTIKNTNDQERQNRAKQQAQNEHQNAKRSFERARDMSDLELK